MKRERGPAAARWPLRWALSVLAAVTLASAGPGCFGGDDEPSKPPGALAAALSYLPSSTGLVVVLPTAGDRGPLRALERLGRRQGGWQRLRGRLERELARSGLDPVALRPQLGNPLALGLGATDDPIAALRVREPDLLRLAAQARIDAGRAEPVDARDGALAWRERGTRGGGQDGFAAVVERELVVATSKRDLDDALEAGAGADSIAFDERFLAELRRLGGEALVRSVGDAQRMLGDPVRAADLRRIRWVRALGLLTAAARVGERGVRIEFRLRTDRVPLAERDLPLASGPRAPRLHDAGAAAAFAVRQPDRLAAFLERSAAVTNPNGFARYEAAVAQLRSLFAVDLHRDLLRKMTGISVALASLTRLTFEADLRAGAPAQVAATLRRAAPAIDFSLEDFLPGTRLVPSGGAPVEWEVRRGRLPVARYAVRDGALVGSLGLGELPVPTRGTRLRGLTGSLIVTGDLDLVGGVLGLVLDLPARALGPVAALGDVELGVRTDTQSMSGSGRLRVSGGR